MPPDPLEISCLRHSEPITKLSGSTLATPFVNREIKEAMRNRDQLHHLSTQIHADCNKKTGYKQKTGYIRQPDTKV